ncbi:bifunctional folylpolyglutamate synthase/dihydrofolate synthase [Flavobacterium selenitireducens]|uniref:bifunctional folylpolyglutamate synthase/dihydrofolate synthase n=1 Tax=Flavobacterium selenitireducens TaxID=2722704 RepID=UPI00168ADA99|nr:folylpolyglutamate synthase/dihydrofolate synthase family protein [Flavobacterium selenitireducens]MBD3583664.1 bifunctional folylpolyglutamate synthase/dihydrofolate synthase [Flavobacterium selenitireducens]
MTYSETVDWMFNQLPMYQTQGASAFRKNLDNTHLLADYLGNPERKLACIHVAGTNGKGSTSHLLASVFQQAGYKTGLFTSPHLKDYRERIKIDGQEIPEDHIVAFVAKHKALFEANNLSFFEMSVGLAFDYFVAENVDIAIIETGLGGRLDSTNIVTPLVSVITNIGFDHVQFLGNTLESIAFEKAGIIKRGVPVVIGETLPQTKDIFEETAIKMEASIVFASEVIAKDLPSDLVGDYQFHNKKTALATLRIVREQGRFVISDAVVTTGFLNVVKNTGLLGRWQKLGENPTIICDTAHNKHGLEIVINQLERLKFEILHIVLGVVNDKELSEILPLFPKDAHYYFCKPNIPRGLDQNTLQSEAASFGLNGNAFDSVPKAYAAAKRKACSGDLIYVGGSTFVVAEIL